MKRPGEDKREAQRMNRRGDKAKHQKAKQSSRVRGGEGGRAEGDKNMLPQDRSVLIRAQLADGLAGGRSGSAKVVAVKLISRKAIEESSIDRLDSIDPSLRFFVSRGGATTLRGGR
ncbi:unnamed protein product [Calypogeia fissa]